MRSLLLLLFLISVNVYAQTGRYLQEVNLMESENLPYYFSRTHSLPLLVIEGIRSNKIKPYSVDYDKNLISPMSSEEYRRALILYISDYGYDYGDVDTIMLIPSELKEIKIDITRKNNKTEKINYIHFYAEDPESYLSIYRFSVAFSELAHYLDEKKALWIFNGGPLVWKNQIIHTYDPFPFINDILLEYPDAGWIFLHLAKDKQGNYEKMEMFNADHELLAERLYSEMTSGDKKANITLMSEALFSGMYTPLYEKLLNTSIPEDPSKIKFAKLNDAFAIMHTEKIYMKLPANEKFFKEEKEISTLIMNAVENGTLSNIYSNDSLSIRMSLAEWQERASEEVASYGAGWENVEENGEMIVTRYAYTGQSASVLTITWKKFFNTKGEVVNQIPHAIGLFIGAEETVTGLNKLLGYFAFNDIYLALRSAPEVQYTSPQAGNYIDDLLKENYYSYWLSTSDIVVEKGNSFEK